MPDLSVADNICITDPPRRFGLIDRRAQRRRAEELLARVGCEDIHPRAPVKDLPLSRRQMVEIAKALGREPRLLILDEATSALTAADVETVFALLKRLRGEGLAHPLHLAPHARDRRRSPTTARCSATAATSRPSRKGTRSRRRDRRA